ncbi:MAG TPA: N4-gp56 family major capsid protein [Spirochaetota bacterium]|nr:N4-gp56 family major capsid protein [Spirochaetota bacterium]
MGASTTFASGDALTKKVWSAKLFKEVMREMFFTKFMGESADSVIQVKTDLKKEKGDRITVGLRMRLTESGQTSSTTGITLEGNEEALTFYSQNVSISEYGHAVRTGSKLDMQRPAFDLRTEMKDALKEWVEEKLEKLILTAMITSPTSEHYLDKTSNTLTAEHISAVKRQAQLASPKVRPVKIDGKEYYAMICHPYATKYLKYDDDWRNAQQYANIRGKDNPLFTGAIGVYDGVVIHEYDRSDLLLTGTVVRSVLCGAQAGLVAWAQTPSWYEKLFDYERIPGVASDMLVGVAKSVFNSKDFGCFTLDNDYAAD